MPMLNLHLRFALICALISPVFIIWPVFLSADTVVEEIIARVNNQIITRSDYQHEQQQLKEEAQQQDPAHADQIVSEGQKDVLRGLVDRELLLERGKDLGISADTEIVKKHDEMRKQIKARTNFDEIAKKESGGPSASQGGDLGYFKRNTLAKQLEDLTFGMKKDQVSDVIRTKQGFVILKVTDHETAGIPPFSEVAQGVQERVYMQKLQPALREYLKKLREDAFVDIKPGYVDTGASPNQSKPVVTSAAKEASAKELKKRKKIGLF